MFDFSRLRSVADISRVHAAERPDAVALDYKDRITTYGELDTRASRVAQGLIALDQKPGARVGYLGKNCDRFFEVLLGTFKARAVTVGVNWRLAAPEIAYVLGDAGCETIFVGAEFYATVEKILPDCPRLKTVIAMGTQAHTSVLHTGAAAALRGYKVIVPVDAMSGDDAWPELYTAWHLANAARISPQVTLTRLDMIKF